MLLKRLGRLGDVTSRMDRDSYSGFLTLIASPGAVRSRQELHWEVGQRSLNCPQMNLSCCEQPNALSEREFVARVDFREWVEGLLPGLRR